MNCITGANLNIIKAKNTTGRLNEHPDIEEFRSGYKRVKQRWQICFECLSVKEQRSPVSDFG